MKCFRHFHFLQKAMVQMWLVTTSIDGERNMDFCRSLNTPRKVYYHSASRSSIDGQVVNIIWFQTCLPLGDYSSWNSVRRCEVEDLYTSPACANVISYVQKRSANKSLFMYCYVLEVCALKTDTLWLPRKVKVAQRAYVDMLWNRFVRWFLSVI